MRKILTIAALALASTAAFAQEPTQGQGILCDTQKQVIALAEAGGGSDGLKVINAYNPHACAWVIVRFTDPHIVGETTMSNRRVSIVEITVTHYFANGTWFELAPSPQFTLVNLGEGV